MVQTSTRIAPGISTIIGTSDRRARRRLLLIFAALTLALAPASTATPALSATPVAGAARGSGAVKADYDPGMGVRIASPDGAIELTAPVNALAEPATFSQETLAPPSPAGGVRLARAFRLEAVGTGSGQPITRFAKPLRLVVRFTDADVSAVRARAATALRIFYEDAAGVWKPIPTRVDVSAHTLSAEVDHFTTFGSGTLGIDDDFNRPDSAATLGSSTSGQSWQTDGSDWGICAAQACVFGPAGTGDYVRIDSGLTDQHVSVEIEPRTVGATGQAGILLGVTPDWNTNLLYVGLDPAGMLEVWTLTGGGTWSNGAVYSVATTYTGTTEHVLDAGTSGAALTVLIDGVQVLGGVTVPAAPADGTMVGLFVDGTESAANWPTYEDFTVTPGP
jgi:hypothetical protein